MVDPSGTRMTSVEAVRSIWMTNLRAVPSSRAAIRPV
jgi:hypothetical protein